MRHARPAREVQRHADLTLILEALVFVALIVLVVVATSLDPTTVQP